MADDGAVVVGIVASAKALAAAGTSDFALTREVHQCILAAGVTLDVVACSRLVYMDAKCGDVAAALRWFRTMAPANNVMS